MEAKVSAQTGTVVVHVHIPEEEPEGRRASQAASMLEEMEREKALWEAKALGVASGSRPGTATGSRPSTGLSGEVTGRKAESRSATAGSASAANAANAAYTSAALPGTAGEQEQEEGQIAEALRNAGVVPSPKALREYVSGCLVAGVGDATAGTSSNWKSSARSWAQDRMRRKKEVKEVCGAASATGTPSSASRASTPLVDSCT